MYRQTGLTLERWLLGGFHGRFIPADGGAPDLASWGAKELGPDGVYVSSSIETARLYASAAWAQKQRDASSPQAGDGTNAMTKEKGSVCIFKVFYDADAGWYEPLPIQAQDQWSNFPRREKVEEAKVEAATPDPSDEETKEPPQSKDSGKEPLPYQEAREGDDFLDSFKVRQTKAETNWNPDDYDGRSYAEVRTFVLDKIGESKILVHGPALSLPVMYQKYRHKQIQIEEQRHTRLGANYQPPENFEFSLPDELLENVDEPREEDQSPSPKPHGKRFYYPSSTSSSTPSSEVPAPHFDDHRGVLINALEIPANVAQCEEVAKAVIKQGSHNWNFLTDPRTIPSQYKVTPRMIPFLDLEDVEWYEDPSELAKVLDQQQQQPAKKVTEPTPSASKRESSSPTKRTSFQARSGVKQDAKVEGKTEARNPLQLRIPTEPDGDCFFSALGYFTQQSPKTRFYTRQQAHKSKLFALKDGTTIRDAELVREDISIHLARLLYGKESPFDVLPEDEVLSHVPKAAEFKERWDLVTQFGENTTFLRPTLAAYIHDLPYSQAKRGHLKAGTPIVWGDAELLGSTVAEVYGRDVLIFPTPFDVRSLGVVDIHRTHAANSSGAGFFSTLFGSQPTASTGVDPNFIPTQAYLAPASESVRRGGSERDDGTKESPRLVKLPIELFYDPRRMHFDVCAWRGAF